LFFPGQEIEMYGNKLLTQTIEDEKIIQKVTLKDAKLDEAKPNEVSSFNDGILGFSLAFILSWMVVCITILRKRKVARNEVITALKCEEQVYCKSCRFFSNNPYLKCALHPSIALTKEAKDCADYALKL
jgi:hypothetical protein